MIPLFAVLAAVGSAALAGYCAGRSGSAAFAAGVLLCAGPVAKRWEGELPAGAWFRALACAALLAAANLLWAVLPSTFSAAALAGPVCFAAPVAIFVGGLRSPRLVGLPVAAVLSAVAVLATAALWPHQVHPPAGAGWAVVAFAVAGAGALQAGLGLGGSSGPLPLGLLGAAGLAGQLLAWATEGVLPAMTAESFVCGVASAAVAGALVSHAVLAPWWETVLALAAAVSTAGMCARGGEVELHAVTWQAAAAVCTVAIAAVPSWGGVTPNQQQSSGGQFHRALVCVLVVLPALIFASAAAPGGHDCGGGMPQFRALAGAQVQRSAGGLVKGVVIFLDSDRKPLIGSTRRSGGRSALSILDKAFLRCHPYPVHVFKERPTDEWARAVRKLTASKITYTDVSSVFASPPYGVPPEVTTHWIEVLSRGEGHHLGYRLMCRFFAGLFVHDPHLRRYDYYWRLDTDSWVDFPPAEDPFLRMAQRRCVYGHHGRMHRDGRSVTRHLLRTATEWADAYGVPRTNLTRLRSHAPDPERLPMFYNNFEISSVRFLLTPPYQSYFRYADATDGFLKHRWGDAPFRTLGVHMMLGPSQICDLSKVVSYHHGDWSRTRSMGGKTENWPEPKRCPSESMSKNAQGVYPDPAGEGGVEEEKPVSPVPSAAPVEECSGVSQSGNALAGAALLLPGLGFL
eukprot:Hpha_TRINITY_DN4363_c1_g1::TRINITY_DN4363_c1_g1_i1::g.50235::m.50235